MKPKAIFLFFMATLVVWFVYDYWQLKQQVSKVSIQSNSALSVGLSAISESDYSARMASSASSNVEDVRSDAQNAMYEAQQASETAIDASFEADRANQTLEQ